MVCRRPAAGGRRLKAPALCWHRQPTPGSIAEAESSVGDASARIAQAANAAIARAREADLKGHQGWTL
jgi:hypothetical protein